MSQSQVQKEVPRSQPQRFSLAILAKLGGTVAEHSEGEPEMVVGERVFGMRADDIEVATDCVGVILDTEGVVGANVADLRLIDSTGVRAIRNR